MCKDGLQVVYHLVSVVGEEEANECYLGLLKVWHIVNKELMSYPPPYAYVGYTEEEVNTYDITELMVWKRQFGRTFLEPMTMNEIFSIHLCDDYTDEKEPQLPIYSYPNLYDQHSAPYKIDPSDSALAQVRFYSAHQL